MFAGTTRQRSRVVVLLGVVAIGSLLAAACSSDDDSSTADTTSTTRAETSTTAAATSDQTIVEIAAGNPDFTTLVSAVQAAGLAETLSGEGPFTVFAPTNEAFAKIPAATLASLLEPANQATLQKILTYHVVAGEVLAADVKPGPVTTVEGSTFTVEVDGSDVILVDGQGNRSMVTTTDIQGSNGVIHVIDGVLLPPDVTL
jgi:uncharacterized surface protein with fasciclin (FAS1) repeats